MKKGGSSSPKPKSKSKSPKSPKSKSKSPKDEICEICLENKNELYKVYHYDDKGKEITCNKNICEECFTTYSWEKLHSHGHNHDEIKCPFDRQEVTKISNSDGKKIYPIPPEVLENMCDPDGNARMISVKNHLMHYFEKYGKPSDYSRRVGRDFTNKRHFYFANFMCENRPKSYYKNRYGFHFRGSPHISSKEDVNELEEELKNLDTNEIKDYLIEHGFPNVYKVEKIVHVLPERRFWKQHSHFDIWVSFKD
jgi:hypothetical protein